MAHNSKINRVLVTGGAGYVGAVLVPKLLTRGYRVTVLDWYIYGEVFRTVKHKENLKEIKGDIRDERTIKKALIGIDAVIHLACISNDPSFELNPSLGKSVNSDATKMIIDLAKKAGVKRFIYASSSSVYGVKKEKEVTEDLKLEPLTDYSKFKATCEDYLLSRQSPGFVCLVLRPATVCGYSPRLRLDLTVNILTINALTKGKMTVFGGGQLRPNIHIEDMTDLYVKTLQYPNAKIAGKTYNAGYENYTVRKIAQMVKKVLKNKNLTIEIQKSNDNRSYKISSEKIKRELGFVPKHTVEEAIGDIKKAYEKGLIPDPSSNARYFNIKMMQKMKIK